MPPKKRRKKEFSKEEWKVQRGRRYRKKKAAEEKHSGWDDTKDRGTGYSETVKSNDLFEKYYQGLGIVSSEEWPVFLNTLRENLPATFRITGTRSLAAHVLSCLKKRFFVELSGLEVEGEALPPPSPLPWYPGDLAWSVPLTKKFIRKSPLLSKFHSFLVRENEQGNISRQEAVSMIPPLVMDVKPWHKVLDMCAAPGSKTSQLLEFLHAEDSHAHPMPSGVVVANDANNKRCYMLVHQAKRLNSPCLMVTNHDASVFPMLYHHDDSDVRHPVYYDRVLCDVPCSGDGTMRKNPSIWTSWNPLLGPSLHKMQLRILNRGLELLVPGGRLVYSTCSLNPVENEAVVATALELCKGAVELVDCRESLEGLKSMPGVTSWKAMSKEGEWIEDREAVPKALSQHLRPSMFPPDGVQTLGLERCVRVLPHFQDSGGFFIAVLEKKEWLPWQSKMKAKWQRSTAADSSTKPSTPPLEPLAAPTEDPSTVQPSDPSNVTPADPSVISSEDNSSQDPSTTTSVDPSISKEAEDERTRIPSAGIYDSSEGVEGRGSESADPTPSLGDTNGGDVSSTQGSGSNSTPKQSNGEAEKPSVKILGRPDLRSGMRRGFKEDPYVFFERDSEFFDDIKPHYGFPENFPHEQLLTRTRVGKKKNLYFSSKLVKELTVRNEHVLKIINIGVKVMTRCDHPRTPCSFRLSQEGVESLTPYISNHCVPVEQSDLTVLLLEANPLIISLSSLAQDALQPLGIGPVVFKYTPDDTAAAKPAEPVESVAQPVTSEDPVRTNKEDIKSQPHQESEELTISCPIYLSGWLAAKSVRLFLDKNYRYHFLSMLGHDPPPDLCLNTLRGRTTAEGNEEGVVNEGEGVVDQEGDMAAAGGELGGGGADQEGDVAEEDTGCVACPEGNMDTGEEICATEQSGDAAEDTVLST